ncbi:MAG: phosphotransferase [Candidatus Aminicenantes bacterium]|nr:phosphotransferase [Candidatus Aminicenantes bacterium]
MAEYKGIMHFHSRYSFDSLLSIKKIVKLALLHDLNFLLLTDHDTTAGSRQLKKEVENRGLAIEAPTAAEYHTEYGDVIAAFITTEINERRFDYFVEEVRKQGGLLLLPHPYRGHDEIDKLAQAVDLIEIFNPRVSAEENEKALKLARKYKKRTYYGSDMHLESEFANIVVLFKNVGTLKDSLLQSKIRSFDLKPAKEEGVILTQVIKALKKGKIRLLLSQLKSLFKARLK